MYSFRDIPKEYWPKVEDHIDYDPVYRAVKSTSTLGVQDFLPSIIEYENQKRTFKKLFDGAYSVSVFSDLEAIERKIEEVPNLKEKTKAIAVGKTTMVRGVSPKENKHHHVNYYLYNYVDNSPKDDFRILKVRGIDE